MLQERDKSSSLAIYRQCVPPLRKGVIAEFEEVVVTSVCAAIREFAANCTSITTVQLLVQEHLRLF